MLKIVKQPYTGIESQMISNIMIKNIINLILTCEAFVLALSMLVVIKILVKQIGKLPMSLEVAPSEVVVLNYHSPNPAFPVVIQSGIVSLHTKLILHYLIDLAYVFITSTAGPKYMFIL